MHRLIILFVPAALFLRLSAAAAPLPSLAGPQIPRTFGAFEPRPGARAEYAVTEKGSSGEITMHMSTVGAEGDAAGEGERQASQGIR